MKTLRDAWDWYESTRSNLQRMQRLGEKHWDDDSLKEASIWKDERFKQLEIAVESEAATQKQEDERSNSDRSD